MWVRKERSWDWERREGLVEGEAAMFLGLSFLVLVMDWGFIRENGA